MQEKGQRTVFIDLLRVIACFGVIINHTSPEVFKNSTPENIEWGVSVAYFFMCKIAVPIFLMISGYLLLGRQEPWKKHIQRIVRICVALVACVVVYELYDALIKYYPHVSFREFLKEVASVYIKEPSNALWYMYTYLGILVMMPFLQKMAALMTKKDYYILFAISGVCFATIPMLNHFNDLITYNYRFDIPLYGSYICMLFIGQYFARFGIEKKKSRIWIAAGVFVAMTAFNVIATYFEYYKSPDSYLFFDNRRFLPIVLQSTSVFYIVSHIQLKPRAASLVSFTGACTFGIYLGSDLLIEAFEPIQEKLMECMNPVVALVAFELFVFGLALLIVALLKKIPYVKELL